MIREVLKILVPDPTFEKIHEISDKLLPTCFAISQTLKQQAPESQT